MTCVLYYSAVPEITRRAIGNLYYNMMCSIISSRTLVFRILMRSNTAKCSLFHRYYDEIMDTSTTLRVNRKQSWCRRRDGILRGKCVLTIFANEAAGSRERERIFTFISADCIIIILIS